MKTLVFLAAIFFALGASVFAQNVTLAQPGLLPGNPFHPFQDFFEQFQLFFAFSPQDKANVHLQLAEKRLAELNLALQQNKTDLVPTISQDFENEINDTESNVNNAQALGQNVTELVQHVAEETFKHQLVLQDLLNKVPEQAKVHIENALNKSEEGHNNAVESILESRNVTGNVNITFTIDNQTFTQTFTVTSDHGKPHIESEHTETETSTTTELGASNEASCINSGGSVVKSTCCKSADDFPNNCLIGACGCSSDNSHEINTCQCPQGECWNGISCVSNSNVSVTTSTNSGNQNMNQPQGNEENSQKTTTLTSSSMSEGH